MPVELSLLIMTAASIGVVHTLLGPDHYVPFVAMGASQGWSTRRTLWITAVCGAGHVLGSVLIGAAGLALGATLTELEWFEGLRGDTAAWLLAGLGLAYCAWGVKQALRNRPHAHEHRHSDGTLHDHGHGHQHEHLHAHARHGGITPWALFVVFILGPCEPLIPVLMIPALRHSIAGTVAVVAAFGAATISTMLGVVLLARRGLRAVSPTSAERWSHALAGAALGACGLGMLLLGL